MRIVRAQNFSEAACLIVPVFSQRSSWSALPESILHELEELIAQGNFYPSGQQRVELFNVCGVARLVFVPLGKSSRRDLQALRLIGARSHSLVSRFSLKSFVIYAEHLPDFVLQAFVEGLYLADSPVLRKSEQEMQRLQDKALDSVYVISAVVTDAQLGEWELMAASIVYARFLTATSVDVVDVDYIQNEAFALANAHASIDVNVLGRDALLKENMNLFLAVGRASIQEPRLIEMTYNPAGCQDEDPIVFVAKGVLFDTGGINLKPAEGMKDMSMDMGGSAVVLATMKLLAELGIKRKVVALLAMTDNSCGENAYLQSEVLTSAAGITVEVAHTDAEGRLILADTMVYARRFSPAALIDVATLTLGTIQSLGYETASLYSNNDHLSDDLLHASLGVSEAIWRMPLNAETRRMVQSKVADIKNLGDPVACKAGSAAAFLEKFAQKSVPWAHLDIAGVTKRSPNALTTATGYTGFGVRLLLEYVQTSKK